MRYNDGRERPHARDGGSYSQRRTVNEAEMVLLTAIVALATQLPDDLSLYGSVLADMRRNFFKIRPEGSRGRRGEDSRGFTKVRDLRASRRYGS